jgi:hypothetical protein
LDVSGVTGDFGACFTGAGGGVCGSTFALGTGRVPAAFCGGEGFADGFDTAALEGETFAGAVAFALVVFEVVAFVDFARVVVFLVTSAISGSTGSGMTFLGLPLFLTMSEDILERN